MTAEAAPRIGLLGPLYVEGVQLEGSKQRALFTLLALRAGAAVTADELAEGVWPGELPANARVALQQQVSRLRRRLGAVAEIRHRLGSYVLELDPMEVDAHRFEAAVHAAQRLLDGGDTRGGAAALRAALGLWRGAALADSRYDGFAQPEIARLEDLHVQAQEDLLGAHLNEGEGPELVGELQALVAAHPLRERLRAHLMHALYRSGRQSHALEAMRDGTRTLRDELGLQAGPELRAMERRILQQDPALRAPVAAAPCPIDVPAQPNATVGRDADVDAVVGLLRDPAARLVTLTGPGGVGKSRVACCAAPLAADAFPGGIVHVDLEAAEPGPAALATAASRADRGGIPALLVLDGFERLAGHAPEVAALLAAHPQLTVLVTSRVALRLTSEHAVAVAPLGPAAASDLFVRRAAAACPGWDAERQDAATIVRICARLDGLPLAIELAAAQVDVRSVGELLERLDDPLGTLVDGPLDLPPRQRSLRASLAASWASFDARERTLLGRLSALDGEVSLAAMDHACNVDGALGASAAPVVASLLGKAALVRTDRGDGPRFRMLTTLRAYAIEQAAGVDDLVAVRERHTSLEGVTACA